jgi:porphobilinogen deaminase
MSLRAIVGVPSPPMATRRQLLCHLANLIHDTQRDGALWVATGPGQTDNSCGEHLRAELRRLAPDTHLVVELIGTVDPVISLQSEEIDLAVADLSAHPRIGETLPDGVDLVGVLARRSAKHVVIMSHSRPLLHELPRGARVGTTPHCAAQLSAWRPDLVVSELVDPPSRWRQRIETGVLDALIVAKNQCPKGLQRWATVLLPHASAEIMGEPVLLPAPGAGLVGLLARVGEPRYQPIQSLAGFLTCRQARVEHAAEHAFLIGLERAGLLHAGTDAETVAVHARAHRETLTATGALIRSGRTSPIREITGPAAAATSIGLRLAAAVTGVPLVASSVVVPLPAAGPIASERGRRGLSRSHPAGSGIGRTQGPAPVS